MTSKKNNNEHIEPEEQSAQTSANTTEATATETKADLSSDKATAATQAAPDSQASEASQPSRGSKMGTIAIVLTLLFGGGLTYHIQQKSAGYEQQINALRSEMAQLKTQTGQQLDNVRQDVLSQAEQIGHRSEVELGQQQKSIESLQLALADVKGRRPNPRKWHRCSPDSRSVLPCYPPQ